MDSVETARRLRRNQTAEERQLWRELRGHRFAGFKFRRQHPIAVYFLDFYCPAARLSVELDGFQHGLPEGILRDAKRAKFLAEQNIEELRFWNHQWRRNREGCLLEIWNAVQRRSGCVQVIRDSEPRFIPPDLKKIKAGSRKPLGDASAHSV
jgi:very-short-patch-repair endonuclease